MQTNPFITTALFELWVATVFVPIAGDRRRDLAYDGRASILRESLGSHHIAKFLSECETREIEILLLILHPSDQIQPLDVLIFTMMDVHENSL
jgi:hypothetical protein